MRGGKVSRSNLLMERVDSTLHPRLSLGVPIYLDEAISLGECSGEVYPRLGRGDKPHHYHYILYGLPAQEGIGLFINDIPDIGRIGLAKSDGDYPPVCP